MQNMTYCLGVFTDARPVGPAVKRLRNLEGDTVNVEAKLGRNVFKLDKTSHIEIDADVCRSRCSTRYCLFVCPAEVYSWNEERQQVHVEFEGCLECGTCTLACQEGTLQWRHPQAGFGVQYRFG